MHRRAPEHVRPVCASEARQITAEDIREETPNINNPPTDLNIPENNASVSGLNQVEQSETSGQPIRNDDNSSQSQDQPDTEPEGGNSDENPDLEPQPSYIDTPIPNIDVEDDLVTTHLLCCETKSSQWIPLRRRVLGSSK